MTGAGLKLPLLVLFLSVSAAGRADAFLFGKVSDKKAQDMLSGMDANFEKGDCQAVAEIYQALLGEKPPSAIREKAYSYLGRCYEAQGLTDRAMTVYKLAEGVYPDNAFFSERLASIYLKTGFYDTAVPLFEKSLKIRRDNVDANAGLARSYAALGFLSKAKVYYSKAAILGEFGNKELLKEYARQMLRKRDWEEAALIAGYALKAAPGDPEIYGIMARISAGTGDYAKAAEHMRSALTLSPVNSHFVMELALIEILAGKYDEALAVIGEASSAAANDEPMSLLLRGMALYKKGDRIRASKYFKQAAGGSKPFVAAFAAALLRSDTIAGDGGGL